MAIHIVPLLFNISHFISCFDSSMTENDVVVSTNRQRRLRTRMAMVLLCLIAKSWVREALSFRPTTFRRRISNFEESFLYSSSSRRRTTTSGSNVNFRPRQNHCVATASLVSKSEIDGLAEVPPTAFDYRKIPPISDTTPCEVIDAFECNSQSENPFHYKEEFYFPSPEELATLPKGDRGGYHIVRQYTVAVRDVDANTSLQHHQSADLTLQNALAVLDPENYPTLSRARKACRKGMVLIHHRSTTTTPTQKFHNDDSHPDCVREESFEITNLDFKRGSVGDRVEPGDVIGVQMFLGTYRKKQCYPNIEYSRPQFQLPILYEDDHLAVVNKPAGVAVYSETRQSGGGDKTGKRKTVHFLLPFVLTPPKKGTQGGILRRPGIVHRLDKPTSGLLLVAKTKASMEHLYQQFRGRQIQKIYTAIVNGDLMPLQVEHQQQQQEEAKERLYTNEDWNIIDYPVGGKYALTSWKILKRAQSLNARDGVLTMVRVRLHTGRYHQIRRHFSWWCFKPLVGDHLYAGLLQAHHFRRKGLFLSSNGISFLHPIQDGDENSSNAESRRVEVTIDIPKRFDKLMKAEESWAIYNSKKESY